MAATQMMCARVGMATGRGLAGALCQKLPDWSAVARATFVPTLPATREGWAMLVAVLGTTISPYLFFWQASEEVEEANSVKRLHTRMIPMRARLLKRRLDVGVGTFFSNVGMYFIMLTTALMLHRNGITHIETSKEAAEALRPLAGNFAALLFTVAIIGVGFLAVPIMSVSAAYAVAETLDWRHGFKNRFETARAFYAIIILSTLLGIAIDFTNVNAIKALFAAAVLNGLLAPFLLFAILIVATDRTLMRNHPAPLITTLLVAVTTLAMLGAALGMFLL